MVVADSGARLDRIRGDAGVAHFQRDGVFGAGERGVGRVLAAHHQRERHIVGRLVPNDRRAGLDRILDIDHRRQRLVVDLDQFGGVLRLGQSLGDDEGDALAHGAHLVGGENTALGAKAFRPAHVFGHRGRQPAELIGQHIGAGQNGEHAVGGLGLGGVDALDARMRVRRHDNDGVALQRQVEIVDVTAAAGDEARVFNPRHGLADAKFRIHAIPPRFAAPNDAAIGKRRQIAMSRQ